VEVYLKFEALGIVEVGDFSAGIPKGKAIVAHMYTEAVTVSACLARKRWLHVSYGQKSVEMS
jgi:hypothetical protein